LHPGASKSGPLLFPIATASRRRLIVQRNNGAYRKSFTAGERSNDHLHRCLNSQVMRTIPRTRSFTRIRPSQLLATIYVMMKTLVGCPHSPVQEECDEILDSTWGRWEQLSILLLFAVHVSRFRLKRAHIQPAANANLWSFAGRPLQSRDRLHCKSVFAEATLLNLFSYEVYDYAFSSSSLPRSGTHELLEFCAAKNCQPLIAFVCYTETRSRWIRRILDSLVLEIPVMV